MAVVVKCDFCGDEFPFAMKAEVMGTINVKFPKHEAGKEQDICPTCILKIDSVVGNKIIPDGIKV